MLDAWDAVLTLSTTIPLTPPASATVTTFAPVVPAGKPPVMLKALIHPPGMVAEQLLVTDTKRNSAPLAPTLGLKNAVSGEHSWPPLDTSIRGPLLGVLFMVEPAKPILYNAGLLPLAPTPPTVPHT